MDTTEILQEVNKEFIDVMNNDSILLSAQTTTNDIDEWDSLSHIQLIVALEKRFNIKFTSSEIQNWKNVGEMIGSIESRIK
jgi:acyl carrier protein